jgi:uncharacterized protein YneF (UPF0154 family)
MSRKKKINYFILFIIIYILIGAVYGIYALELKKYLLRSPQIAYNVF